MLETTYIPLNKAAELLGTDADTVLLAAAEGRLHLYWLFNKIVRAERGYYADVATPSEDEPPVYWVTTDFATRHFVLIPLHAHEAAELIKHGRTKSDLAQLSFSEGPPGEMWILPNNYPVEKMGLSESDLDVSREIVFAKRSDVENILGGGATPASDASPEQRTPMLSRDHVSNRLAAMNRAALKFWANADRVDRGTHPENSIVATWFEKNGFSATLADKAATIIRPEWAPSGRKPEV